jgi:hypothetical protein
MAANNTFKPDTQTLNYVTQTLINVTGGTEVGTSLPPRQKGEFRVPFVKNLRLGPISSYFGGTQFTLVWDQPDTTESISHYNVFLVGALDNTTPLGPYSSVMSPAIFRVTPSTASVITFYVQTQLHNGNVSEIESSPSVTSLATPPQIKNGDITPGTIFPSFAGQAEKVLGSYNSVVGDSIVYCDTSGGNATIKAPPTPTHGQFFYVKKITNDVNTITVQDDAGNPIEGGLVIPGGSLGAAGIYYDAKTPAWWINSKV